MPLNLMYITNRPEIAQIAESSGVNRIFVDMEYIGSGEKTRRTVISLFACSETGKMVYYGKIMCAWQEAERP